MDFWNTLPKHFTALAPMEGVTDIIFRQVVAKTARPDVFFTEFTNVSSYASEQGRANALERLAYLPEEQPIVAQIWGTNPNHFAFAANGVKNLGYLSVDINMGCPERHVVATGGGSGLIKTPELAAKIIEATKTAGLPVSVKTRLGYSSVDEWQDWLTHLLKQDLAALTVHLRTKKEMSKVPAHHELIPEIVALRDKIAPETKLILNGDFTDKRVEPFCNADGIMIGRGIFQNPFCFEKESRTHGREELIGLLRYHLDLFDRYQLQNFAPLKRFFKIYINHFSGASDIRAQLMECQNTSEVREQIQTLE